MARTHPLRGWRARRARPQARRPPRGGAAEPLGDGHTALVLPDARHHRHADQLAFQGRRDRVLRGRLAGARDGVRGGQRRGDGGVTRLQGDSAHLGRWGPGRHGHLRPAARRQAACHSLPRDRRGRVADALHLRHHRPAQGCAAPASRRARRGGRAGRAVQLRRGRSHARGHADVPHDGRALVAVDGHCRRHAGLPAALRARRGAAPDPDREGHQPLSRAHPLP